MNTEVFEDLRRAILNYDKELAINSANKVVKGKLNPTKALAVMTEAIRQVGDGFDREELWLPDLVGAGATMSAAICGATSLKQLQENLGASEVKLS